MILEIASYRLDWIRLDLSRLQNRTRKYNDDGVNEDFEFSNPSRCLFNRVFVCIAFSFHLSDKKELAVHDIE